MRIPNLAAALNAAASEFEIGLLQELRARLRGLSRAPSPGIFHAQTIHDNYAFHLGGRSELQFNIGEEEVEGQLMVRHGVAFSLEPSRSLPGIEPLLPKIERFNDYVRVHPEDFPDLQMWHFDSADRRSEDRPVGPIDDRLIIKGNFIALGRRAPADEVRIPVILADFDRLLPLYIHVETEGQQTIGPTSTAFVPGCPRFVEGTTVTASARTVDVALRHKVLQRALYEHLCSESGHENVSIEHSLDFGVRVDAAVREKETLVFYELKVLRNVQSCVREALGQLLEYAYWPSAHRARDLIVVGEAAVDADAAAYLRLLRERFGLPVWYRRLDFERRRLEPRS